MVSFFDIFKYLKSFDNWWLIILVCGLLNTFGMARIDKFSPYFSTMAVCMGLVFWLMPSWVHAQRPVYDAAASMGTGLSFGPGDGRTVVMMSPIYLDIDFLYANDERPKLEVGVGLQAELQGRVSVGIVPQFRYTTGAGAFMGYTIIGAPLVVAPFALFGLEAGGGLLWRFGPSLGFFIEIVADYFFLGSDLQKSGVLVQLDSNIGVRLRF